PDADSSDVTVIFIGPLVHEVISIVAVTLGILLSILLTSSVYVVELPALSVIVNVYEPLSFATYVVLVSFITFPSGILIDSTPDKSSFALTYSSTSCDVHPDVEGVISAVGCVVSILVTVCDTIF